METETLKIKKMTTATTNGKTSKTGAIVVITGASSGMGLAAAELFTEKGYRVYGLSRHSFPGAKFTQIQTDVNDDLSVQRAVEQIMSESGQIDILINNAGFVIVGAAEESSIGQIKSIFETNFFGAVRMTNAVLPHMRKRRSGRIIHTSSMNGFFPMPFMSYYTATKHALEGYSESLNYEISAFGIRSMLIEPSVVKTGIGAHQIKIDKPNAEYADAFATFQKAIEAEGEQGMSPNAVAEVMFIAANTSSPKLRYPVGFMAGLFSNLRRFAPSKLLNWSIRKRFKI